MDDYSSYFEQEKNEVGSRISGSESHSKRDEVQKLLKQLIKEKGTNRFPEKLLIDSISREIVNLFGFNMPSCEICNGTLRKKCHYCNGSTSFREKCGECKGKKFFITKKRGKGAKTCSSCRGSGFEGGEYDPCYKCRGVGYFGPSVETKVECKKCKGNGFVVCRRCGGGNSLGCTDCVNGYKKADGIPNQPYRGRDGEFGFF